VERLGRTGGESKGGTVDRSGAGEGDRCGKAGIAADGRGRGRVSVLSRRSAGWSVGRSVGWSQAATHTRLPHPACAWSAGRSAPTALSPPPPPPPPPPGGPATQRARVAAAASVSGTQQQQQKARAGGVGSACRPPVGGWWQQARARAPQPPSPRAHAGVGHSVHVADYSRRRA